MYFLKFIIYILIISIGIISCSIGLQKLINKSYDENIIVKIRLIIFGLVMIILGLMWIYEI